MTLIDGLAICCLCGEQFALGQHYEFHMTQCRTKRRHYVKMTSQEKQIIIERMESYIKAALPGTLMGYQEDGR